ncbi:hypothetical protein [Dactylosporangium sp. NPDC048998]|uniref:hypothetical protein n=1 Tax=Dactylosporangium sp. NPDC048998 TaxID=3363976 RepID=UPI003722F41F
MYHEQHPAAGRGRSSRHRRPFGRGRHAAARRGVGLYIAAAVMAAATIGSLYASGSPSGPPGSVAQAAPAPRDHPGETALVGRPSSGADPRVGDQPSRQPAAPPAAQPKPAPTQQRTTGAPRTLATSPRPGTAHAAPVTPAAPAVTSAPSARPSPSDASPSAAPSPSETFSPSPSPPAGG